MLSVQLTPIQQEKITREASASFLCAWGRPGSLTCSSPGYCFCCLVTTGWSQTESPKEFLMLFYKAVKRKPKRNINDDKLLNGTPSISFCLSKNTHMLSYNFSPAQKPVQIEIRDKYRGKNYSTSKAARLTVGSISSWQQAKGKSLNLIKPSISILKAVLYLCTLWIVLVRHIVSWNGHKSTTLSTCS